MTWLTITEYLCQKWPRIRSTCRKHFTVHSSFMTYHRFVTRVLWRVPLVEQKLPTRPKHLRSPPVFSEVCAARSFIFLLSVLKIVVCPFGHCVVTFDLPILANPLVSSNSKAWTRQVTPLKSICCFRSFQYYLSVVLDSRSALQHNKHYNLSLFCNLL